VQNHLVIFAKEPRLGRVKTRLACDIGKVAAWRFYKSMVQNVVRRLDKKGAWNTWLAISPNKGKRRSFGNPTVKLIDQGQGDLGQRMMRPSQILPPGRFIVIGTDVAGIRPHHIRKAFKLLGHNDAVFGPATDGGFWLVGLKRHPITANPYSKNIRWSHPDTLQDCLDMVKTRGRKVDFIDELSDIDDGKSFSAMKKCLGPYRTW